MILLLLCVICIGCGKKDKNEEIADEPILVIEEQEEEEDQVPEINITIPGETTTIETTNTSNASEPTKTTTTTESNSKNSKSTTNTTVINNYTTSNNTTTGTVVPNTSSSANKTSGLAADFERIKNLATTTYTNAENWYNNDVHSYIYDLDQEKLDNLKNGLLDTYDENLGELTKLLVGQDTYDYYKDGISMTYDEYSSMIAACYQGYYTDPDTGEKVYLSEDDCGPISKQNITGYADEFTNATVIGKIQMIEELLEGMGIL